MQPTDPFSGSSGPRNARVAIIGESWGTEEAAARRPFVGSSGYALTKMLSEAGINRDRCFVTNVVNAQPPANDLQHFFLPMKPTPEVAIRGLHPNDFVVGELPRLEAELAEVNPDLIIACGNYALWALSAHTGSTPGQDRAGRATGVRTPTGIMKWRGSMTFTLANGTEPKKLLPIVHPAAILRQWKLRDVTIHDLRTRVPQALANDWTPRVSPTILAPPTFAQATARLRGILLRAAHETVRVSVDVETKRTKQFAFITCISFCDSANFAMSIPFVYPKTYAPFWPIEQEAELVTLMRAALSHDRVAVEGQNFIYDLQYLAEYPAVWLAPDWDTMHAQHVIFPGTQKDLAYLSSLYCRYHRYWKDDNKEWDEKGDLTRHLQYNAEDALRTFEIATQQRKIIPDLGLTPQWEYMQQTTRFALSMMRRGVRIDTSERKRLHSEVMNATIKIYTWFERWLPQSVVNPSRDDLKPWYQSSTQIRQVFLDWGLRLPKNRKTGQASTNAAGMLELRERYPGLTEVFDRLLALRSLRVFAKTFLSAPLEADGRIHCQFNPAGTGTFRFSSAKNAFDRGANLQNIPERERDFGQEQELEYVADEEDVAA